MNYETMKISDIIAWCQKNDKVAWLKAKAKETVRVERYTARKQKVDANGNVVLNKKGSPIYVVDKSSKKVSESIPIDFMSLKLAFCKEFMPEILPVSKKTKAPTMHELIANL